MDGKLPAEVKHIVLMDNFGTSGMGKAMKPWVCTVPFGWKSSAEPAHPRPGGRPPLHGPPKLKGATGTGGWVYTDTALRWRTPPMRCIPRASPTPRANNADCRAPIVRRIGDGTGVAAAHETAAQQQLLARGNRVCCTGVAQGRAPAHNQRAREVTHPRGAQSPLHGDTKPTEWWCTAHPEVAQTDTT